MGYWAVKFGSTDLPMRTPSQAVGIPVMRGLGIATVGGAVDPNGTSEAAVRVPYMQRTEGVVVADTAAALGTAMYALRALYGKRDKLYRARDGGGTEWVYARLTQIDAQRGLDDTLMQTVGMGWQIYDPVWSGSAHSVAGTLTGGTANISLVNNGNARVDNAVITVTVAGAALTGLTMQVAGTSQFTWAGTVAVSDALVFDCGAPTVRNNGVDAYSGFGYGTAHYVSRWLELEPGTTTFTVIRTGGGTATTVGVSYYDGWM
jgi:hypothetical protein